MAISDEELKSIVGVTGAFENSGDPYAGVSGDFDGQGISCGVLQWNIGQGSLQKLVIGAGRDTVLSKMPTFGEDLWRACKAPLPDALAIVRAWQTARRLKPKPRAELTALMSSAPMRAQQDKYIRATGAAAEKEADKWAKARGAAGRSKQELAFFFDLLTQNGNVAKLSYREVTAFKSAAQPGQADDMVCDWLVQTDPGTSGYKDGLKNAKLWRQTAPEASLDLLIFAYFRSQKSKPEWRVDVLNRKGTIATKLGWVHGSRIDLSGVF